MKKLVAKAVKPLVTFKVSVPSLGDIKKDSEEARASEERAKAEAGVAKFAVQLIPKQYRSPVVQATSALRSHVYGNSFCWDNDGWRAMPSDKFPKFETRLNELIANFEDASKMLNSQIPEVNKLNATRMGDWSEKHIIPSDLGLRKVEVMLGSDDGKARLGQIEASLAGRIQKDVETRFNNRMESLMEQRVERVVEVLKDTVNRLSSKKVKGMKFSGMLENIKTLAEVVADLNFTDDTKLDAMTAKLKTMTDNLTDKEIKKSLKIRTQIKTEAEQMLADLMGEVVAPAAAPVEVKPAGAKAKAKVKAIRARQAEGKEMISVTDIVNAAEVKEVKAKAVAAPSILDDLEL